MKTNRTIGFLTAMMLFILALAGVISAAVPSISHQLQFVDEWGKPINMTTSASIYVYDVGTTTAQSLYLDAMGNTAVTQPITDDSSNTGLEYSLGFLRFWTDDTTCKVVATNGTNTIVYDNLTVHDTRLLWPTAFKSPQPMGIKSAVTIIPEIGMDLTAAMSGGMFISKGAGTAAQIDVNLPTCAAGLQYTISDANATAADDVWINCGADDTVNGGTAAKSIKCITDAVGQTITILGIDDTRWIIIYSVGTWANDNS